MKNVKPKSGTVKMKFSADQYYVTAANKEYDLANPKYRANEVYEIDEKEVPRWLKRGGVILTEEKTDGRAQEPAKVEEKVEPKTTESQEQVEATDKKDDDGGKSDSAKTQNAKPGDKGGNKR